MVHKDKRGGTLIIDRTFPGVGRIRKASGTTRRGLFGDLNRALSSLYEQGRLDLLRDLRDHRIAPLALFDAYKHQRLDRLPTAATARPLATAMREWIKGLAVPDDCSEKTREWYETARRHFERTKKDATVSELADVLRTLRERQAKARRSFNLCRSSALAFVRDTVGKHSPLWLMVAAVPPFKKARRDTTRRHPLTPDEMRERFPNRETDTVDAMAWSMATTGMHQKEYWGRWSVKPDRVHIAGTKRETRTRDVPLLLRPTVPAMHRRTFENKLRKRYPDMVVRDFRRTYANWMEEARILRTRRKMYLGHRVADPTDTYERHEVTAFLVEDAAKLRAFIWPQETAPALALVGVR